jgi:hypothetical protein
MGVLFLINELHIIFVMICQRIYEEREGVFNLNETGCILFSKNKSS